MGSHPGEWVSVLNDDARGLWDLHPGGIQALASKVLRVGVWDEDCYLQDP